MFINFTIICFQLSASAWINRLLKNRNILEIEIMAKITHVLVNLRLYISNNYVPTMFLDSIANNFASFSDVGGAAI